MDNFNLDFLKEIINLLSIEYQSQNDAKKEKTKELINSYDWLIEETKIGKSTRAQIVNSPLMDPGKIYIFKYIPKYRETLDYWDKHPVVLSLGTIKGPNGKIMLGLNISWYPPPARKYIVEKIREIYKSKYEDAIRSNSNQANKQKPVLLDLNRLKIMLDQYGLSFALRSYLPSQVFPPKICICYEEWDKALKLDHPRLFPELNINARGFSLKDIYEDFEVYVKDQRKNRQKKSQKRNESKTQNRYRFGK